MFFELFGKITPHLRNRSSELFGRLKSPLTISQHWQCTIKPTKSVDRWLESLPDDKQKRVRHIQNEIALRATEGKRVPKLDTINITQFEEMLTMTHSRRQKYYDYIRVTNGTKTNDNIKQLIRSEVKTDKMRLAELNPKSDHIEYGTGKSTLMFKVYSKTIQRWKNQRIIRAMILNSPTLIFDCDFNDSMTKYEIQDAAKQLKFAFSCNRNHRQPFVMHLCNMKRDSYLWQALKTQMAGIEKLPIRIHDGDITDVFPPEKLVYLSPDAADELHEFNANDHYVVGTIVDKGTQMPLTLAKAKRLNIRCARLPLQKYIRFHSHKTLTLDQMTGIMLELKKSQDWTKALRHVPNRKVLG